MYKNLQCNLRSHPEAKRHLEFNLDNLIQDARESNLPKTVDKEETDLPVKEVTR